MFISSFFYNCFNLNLGRTSKVTPPPWYKGGGGGRGVDRTLPSDFAVFQYFGDIFIIFSRKPLMSSTRCGIYYGLGRCWGPVKLSKMAAIWLPSWILPKINIYQKKGKLEIVNASHVKYDKIKQFAPFCLQFLPFSPKNGEKHTVLPKNGLTTWCL